MYKVITMLALITLLAHTVAPAQNNLFGILPQDTTLLTQDQQLRYRKLLALDVHLTHRLIHIEDLATSQLNGVITLSFQEAPCANLSYLAQNVEYYGNDSNYYWYGELLYKDSAGDCYKGNLMLIARNGEHFGQLQVLDKTFEITSLGGGVQVISAFRELAGKDEEQHSCTVQGTARATETHTEGDPLSFCTVRVLVLYTSSAKAEDPNILNRIDLAMNQSRQALFNSAVYPGYLNLVLAGAEELPYFSEDPGDMSKDIENMYMPSSLGGFAADVRYFRNRHKADLVVLLTRTVSSNKSAGTTHNIQNRDTPYAVVQSVWATNSSYTFAHELGHLLGARHEDDGYSADTNYSLAHAHKFSYPSSTGFWPFRRNYINVQRTLTHSNTKDNGEAVLYWSDPDIYYKGASTGMSASALGARDAAKHLRGVGCEIAGFYAAEPGDFSVAISGAGSLCTDRSDTWYSRISGSAAGPYTYEWAYSEDGIRYGATLATSQDINFTMPAGSGGPILFAYLRLKVTAPGGAEKFAYYPIKRKVNCRTDRIAAATTSDSLKVVLSPSPADGQATLSVVLPQASPLSVFLYSTEGHRLQQVYEGYLPEGPHKIQMNTREYNNGIYYVKLLINSNVATKKLIIRH